MYIGPKFRAQRKAKAQKVCDFWFHKSIHLDQTFALVLETCLASEFTRGIRDILQCRGNQLVLTSHFGDDRTYSHLSVM